MQQFFKPVIVLAVAFIALNSLAGCSTNPATGENQFAALMSPQSEAGVGAEEHQNILREFGGVVKDQALQAYVTRVGQRLAKNTERTDVNYQFFVLDSPVVNAFSLPGGYVYVTRGVLALANSESQLAAVLAHEIGHVTARHAAERYSHGVLTSLGAAAIGAAVGSSAATQVANLGSDLYITSYSRKQETQADELGVRYLYRAGYDTQGMTQFLGELARYSALEAQENGTQEGMSYFSTHPQTAERVTETAQQAAQYPANAKEIGREAYLHAIDGMLYGDNADQGFVRGNAFFHPQMGFAFTAPEGYLIVNNSQAVMVRSKNGDVVALFDTAANPKAEDPMTYMTHLWMKGEKLTGAENITISSRAAATGEFPGVLNGRAMIIHLVAVQWTSTTVFRFQMARPADSGAEVQNDLKRLAESLRPVTEKERQSMRPWRIRLVSAKAGDTVVSLTQSSPLQNLREQRFRAINGLDAGENVSVGQIYKVIEE
jgi:predicted Zn-dependent protease